MDHWSRHRVGLAATAGLVAGVVAAATVVLVAPDEPSTPGAGSPGQPGVAGPAPARGAGSLREPTAPDERQDVPRAWTARDPSVETPPADVVAAAAPDAGANAALRVVSLVNRDGRPVVVVERTRGPAAAAEAVARRQGDDNTVAVSVDTRVTLQSSTGRAPLPVADTLRSSQWALDRLTAEKTWSDYSSGTGAVVAVIDTGIAGNHPDLAGQLTAAGADYVADGGDGRTDPHGHGTHVAGIVAAVRDNDVGIAGLAPSSKVMPVRVLDENGSGWSSDIAKAVIYAADNGADVANLSLGGPNQDAPTQTAVNYAMSMGVVVVAAAGNNRALDNATNYPAAYPGVLAVASTERDDTSSTFSTTGNYVDVAAPGGRILSTVPGGYSYLSGTSMATPYVAATAALVTDITGGTLTTEQFERRLTESAWDLGAPGWDPEFGYGLTNPYRTLCSFTTCDATTSPSPPGSPSTDPEPTPTPSPTPSPTPAASPSPTPSLSPSQPPSPSPSETITPTSSPTPTESPEPSEEPTAEKRSPRLGFTTSGGKVRRGGTVLIALRVTDAETGQAMAGQRVVVRGWRSGTIRVREQVTTDSEGNASLRLRLRRTTRFDLRSPATQGTRAATSPTSIWWRIR